ncbi:Erv1 / Alr family protein [Pirellula sp. SH-Sr6A]|uniref:ERV1/ALR-related protein n=1 Tax=Pirellula sp. SH-Sr6A TaxID=1632865 RepID=UPI00078BB8B0|nr:ERV1/ALR-related protein [Pirellula sp. SH-Sr6A]AMV34588.1 Erv1 / Alr family protein [Pirellula sp. SH-Sr6A]
MDNHDQLSISRPPPSGWVGSESTRNTLYSFEIAPGWESLHRIASELTDWSLIAAWFQEWELRSVPCGDCWKHWRELKQTDPPPFGNRLAFYWWSHRAHNAVADRIGNPVWSEQDFDAEYGGYELMGFIDSE